MTVRLRTVRAVAARLARLQALVAGSLFLVTAVAMFGEVLGRYLLGVSWGVSDELGSFALAVGVSWALGHTLATDGHVRIDLLLPSISPRMRTVSAIIALATMACFSALISSYAWQMAATSAAIGARAVGVIGTPLYVPQALFALGFTVLTVVALTALADTVAVLVVDARSSRGRIDGSVFPPTSDRSDLQRDQDN